MTWVYDNAAVWEDEASYTTTASGLKYALLPNADESAARIPKGHTVPIMYKLFLEDGHKHIYSQDTASGAFQLRVGGGSVIKGFDEAALLMKYGDRGRFLMPSDIAYGPRGQAGFGIPGGATLEYFLEAVAPGSGEL